MKKIFIALILTLSLMACKKETQILRESEVVCEIPKIRIDKHFPTGVLEFKKASDF